MFYFTFFVFSYYFYIYVRAGLVHFSKFEKINLIPIVYNRNLLAGLVYFLKITFFFLITLQYVGET